MDTKPSASFDDIFIAVHGIGEQQRSATVRSVANRLAKSKTLMGDLKPPPVAPQPLGYFHSDAKNISFVVPLDDRESLAGCDLASVGFSEVYWADIPDDVLAEKRTMEEIKAWAQTVVARADALCQRAQADPERNWIVPPDFSLASEVLEEMIQTIEVLENLTWIAQKAGVFTFNLRQVLMEYLGDVQLVTEFTCFRNDIIGRFHAAMKSIAEQNPKARLHIVAHSEGTVVAFMGMLHAMNGVEFPLVNPKDGTLPKDTKPPVIPQWLKQVHGFMTIGSPIDKHLLLWPRLWKTFDSHLANMNLPQKQIRWRNYYDYGDPVGFKLDSARLWLAQKQFTTFEFCGCKDCHHDIGFARYLLPGEAHDEYWNDPDVFEHFITNVVKNPKQPGGRDVKPTPPPPSKLGIEIVSPVLPYLGSLVVLLLGVFIIYKFVHAYTHPDLDDLQKYVRFAELGVQPPVDVHGFLLFRGVLGITALLAGATLLARFSRLAVGWGWKVAGFVALLVGFAGYAFIVPDSIHNELGSHFWYLGRYVGKWAPVAGVLGVTAIAGLTGYLAMSKRLGNANRHQRWFLRGMRPLMISGGIAVAFIVFLELFPREIQQVSIQGKSVTLSSNEIAAVKSARLTRDELEQIVNANPTNWVKGVESAAPVLETSAPLWPLILASAAFFYLWWLATLLFDLSFVWHRYIRHSKSNDRLREWNPYGFAPRRGRHGEVHDAIQRKA